MFKFDNAFLTKNKHVGMQFVDVSVKDGKGAVRTATIYLNNKGQLNGDCSLQPLNHDEWTHLVTRYNKLLPYYHPKGQRIGGKPDNAIMH